MILEISFSTGRYHATPWGRHVNEAAAEWPPSPFRIQRALLDAWYRKAPAIAPSVIERLMKALSMPPLFHLPPARASHTRSYLSQNKADTTNKKLVFDGFVVLDRGAHVLAGWPGLRLDDECFQAAQQLAESLNYLGRSESWVEARFVDDRSVEWNARPYGEGLERSGSEEVSVACVVRPDDFEKREVPTVTEGRGKKKTTRRLGWFEALAWGSAEAIAHTMNRPPALEPVLYLRRRDALDARPPLQVRMSPRAPEGVLFAIDGKVTPRMSQAIEVSEALRRKLMGRHRKIIGSDRISSWFTGKDSDGRPLEGHVHMSILPLDDDRDGRIDRVLILGGQAFGPSERKALDGIESLWQRGGKPDFVLTPILWGRREELCTQADRVVSVTPFVPTQHRHPKRDTDEWSWVVTQLELELDRRGLPTPVRIERIPRPVTGRWIDFRRSRRGDTPRTGYGLRIHFPRPVWAPFSIGYASHYGLGTFVVDPEPR
jgi:CRISPR-associated protein Csb2